MRYRFTSIIIALLVIGSFTLQSCENNADEVNDMNRKKLGIEEAKNIAVNFTLGGKTKAILTAPLMLRVQDTVPYIEFPNTLHVDFYSELGIKESKLDARYSRYKESEKLVFLKDSVRVINMQKGDTLYCMELYWDRSRVGYEF